MAVRGRGACGGAGAVETTLDVTPCSLAEALPYLVQITRPKADTSGGLATVQDVCRHSQVFKATCNGQTVAAFAVEPYEFDRGVCLFLTAGAGALDGVDLSATMLKVLEAQAAQIGARQVGMMTKRRGLIRKLQASGWQVAGVKLVKKL